MAQIKVTSTLECSIKVITLPQQLFNEKFYIEYKNALRECKIKKLTFFFNKSLNSQKYIIGLDIAQIDDIIELPLFKVKLYLTPTMEQFINHDKLPKLNIDNVINNIYNKDFCQIGRSYWGYDLVTYKWNGVRAIADNVIIDDTIVQTKNGYKFLEPQNAMNIQGCYRTIDECKRDNSVKVISFENEDDNHNEVVKLIGTIGEQCQMLRENIKELQNIVGFNAINGKFTKIDDDLITQERLSDWRTNIDEIESFCID